MTIAKKYRKKPVVIEAVYYNGTDASARAIVEWAAGDIKRRDDAFELEVVTLEGEHAITPDYYVIKGVEGEFYGCEPGIFAKTYEEDVPTPQPEPYEAHA